MSAILFQSNIEDACLVAHTWGFDDAVEGLRPRVAEYFDLDSPQWDAYEHGYAEGTEFIFRLGSRRTPYQLGIATERPHDFLVDEEDRHRERRF
jgi:hypothetical protein